MSIFVFKPVEADQIGGNIGGKSDETANFCNVVKGLLKNGIIFKAKPSIFVDLSSVFCEKYCFYMFPALK